MGLVMLGLSTLNKTGLTGAGVQMFSHGIMTALFFAVTGMIYDRAHTRQIPSWRHEQGDALRRDRFHYWRPGFDGHARFLRFIAEFPFLWASGTLQPWVAIIASISIVITAAYIMRNIRDVFFRPMPKASKGISRTSMS